jgi:hypothetical protein
MYNGQIVFSQIMQHVPLRRFHSCVRRYKGNKRTRKFSCYEQFLCMAFAQLTFRESLRDIVACLTAMKNKLYHIGIRGNIARSTLADANERCDWRIFADFATILIDQARELYIGEELCVDLDATAYALDSTMIDLCLSMFPWAQYQRQKKSIKIHTLMNLRGAIPEFIYISDGKMHDVRALDLLIPQPGTYYIMDKGYIDFERLYELNKAKVFFIIPPRSNQKFRRVYSNPVDKTTGVQCDQCIVLTGQDTRYTYPDRLRRIRYYDVEQNKRLVFFTNDFFLPALTIAELYKARWQIELFFKWIKQHLRIKAFYGTSENAVKTQIWIAISVYVLIAILKKRLNLEHSLYTILQILSLTLFEKTPLIKVFSDMDYRSEYVHNSNQLKLFDL